MALPQDFEAYGAVRAAPTARNVGRQVRVAMVAGFVVLAMAAALVCLAGDSNNSAIEDIAVNAVTPEEKLYRLMLNKVQSGNKLSLKDLESQLKAWRDDPNTILDLPEKARTQMLVDTHSSMMFQTSTLADDSQLCAKEVKIITLLDQLLAKLGAEAFELNITNKEMNAAYEAALQSWLDSESEYRLTKEKAKEAADGAEYARQQYEKYNTAYKTAQDTLRKVNAEYTIEKSGLLDEKELILTIMRLLGILNDLPASEQSIAAGAIVPGSPPAAKKAVDKNVLMQKIDQIKAISLKTKVPKMGQMLDQLKSSLAEYAETNEVAQILRQMILDIEDRIKIIDGVISGAQTAVSELQTKVVEWETKLVTLSSAHDKAKAEERAQALERESLAGTKKADGEERKRENSAYKLLLTPYMKEIFIIKKIKAMIQDHCKEWRASQASNP